MNHLSDTLLNEFLDSVLSVGRLRAAQTHLDGCQACRSRLDGLRMMAHSLAALPDDPLAHDLTPAVLSRLPPRRLALGWRLALAVQAGIAIGLLVLVSAQLVASLQALLQATALPVISVPAWSPSGFSLPALRLPAFQLPAIDLPSLDLASPNLILLVVTAVALGALGNSLLLRQPSWSGPRARRRSKR